MLLLPRGAAVAPCLPQSAVLICTAGPTAAPMGACEIRLCMKSSDGGRSCWFGSLSLRSSPKLCLVRFSCERGPREPVERGAPRGGEELARYQDGAWNQRYSQTGF